MWRDLTGVSNCRASANISTSLWSDAFITTVFSLLCVNFVLERNTCSTYLHILLNVGMFAMSIPLLRYFKLVFTSKEKNEKGLRLEYIGALMVRYYRPPWFRPQKCYYIHVAPSFHARCCVHCCGISKAAPHSVPMMDRTRTSVLTDDSHHSQMQCNMSLYDSMMANDDISTQPISALGTDRLILLRLQVF